MAAINNMKAEQELIPGEYTTRIVTAYFIAAGQWSGIVSITISETDNGNFYIPSLGRMFPEPGRVKMGTLEVTDRDEGGSKRLFCVFDRNQHNNGTDDCPYLILGFSHDYHLDNMTEENIMDVAYAIDMLQKKVPQDTDDENGYMLHFPTTHMDSIQCNSCVRKTCGSRGAWKAVG
ncbi:hypothetical protein OG21DRAFT_1506862 [Imleria badia]|nr:hypothetical protein OG21DRAFT_1506862 [Imleria badia]